MRFVLQDDIDPDCREAEGWIGDDRAGQCAARHARVLAIEFSNRF